MVLKGPESPLPQPPGDSGQDEALIEAVAQRVVKMGLAAPAIFFLESTKPLSFVGSQVLVFLEPFVKSLFNLVNYNRFVALMEDRKNIEKLLVRVEDLDEETRAAEKEQKKAQKEARRQAETEQRRLGIQPPGFWARLFGRGKGSGRGFGQR
jgi:hypothetical protein